jgi:hypothetical protein
MTCKNKRAMDVERAAAGCIATQKPTNTVNLTRIDLYVSMFQATVSCIGAYLALTILTIFCSGFALRNLLVSLGALALLTHKTFLHSPGYAVQTLHAGAILGSVPFVWQACLELESADRSIDSHTIHTLREASYALASMFLLAAGLSHALWPTNLTTKDVQIARASAAMGGALCIAMHFPDDGRVDVRSPLSTIPTFVDVITRSARYTVYWSMASCSLLAALTDGSVLTSSRVRLVVRKAFESSVWTLLVPLPLLGVAAAQLIILFARRTGAGGAWFDKHRVVLDSTRLLPPLITAPRAKAHASPSSPKVPTAVTAVSPTPSPPPLRVHKEPKWFTLPTETELSALLSSQHDLIDGLNEGKFACRVQRECNGDGPRGGKIV